MLATDQQRDTGPAHRQAPAAERRVFRLPRRELDRRWAAVRSLLERDGLDALLAHNRRDFHGGTVRWLTDVAAFNPRTVILYRDEPMAVIDHGAAGGLRRLEHDRDHPGVGTIHTTNAVPSVAGTQHLDGEMAGALLARRGRIRVGLVNEGAMPSGFTSALRARAGADVTFIDASDAVDRLKAVKSEDELAAMEAVAHLQDAVFADVLAELRPGMRDFEVTALARFSAERRGSTQALMLASSAPAGQPALLLPRALQGRTIEKGDQLTLLIENNGPSGFYAEFARTVVLGQAAPELRDAFALTLEAQEATVAALRPGADPARLAAAHDAFMTSRGSHPEPRLFAHGQGYDLVERPLIRRDETMVLEAGMCIAVHPAHQDGRVYATVCDNFVVIASGPARRIHRTPQVVFEL